MSVGLLRRGMIMHQSFNKIGIFGGTFNPIHYGHLIIAETVRECFSLDKVLFIPTGQPPHKPDTEVTDSEHRYEMVRLAIASNKFFEASRVEIDREGYSYTIDTLGELRKEYGMEAGLFFIVGADVVPELITWKDFRSVFLLCEYIAVLRPGYGRKALEAVIEQYKKEYDIKIHIIETPMIDISSSNIRERCSRGKSIRYLVSEGVAEYIYSEGVYRQRCQGDGAADTFQSHKKVSATLSLCTLNEIKDKLHKMLSPRRFAHSISVMEASRMLAEKYGEDVDKAVLAGLIHDCARDLKKTETFALCSKYGIIADNVMQNQPELLHGKVGSFLAGDLFGVDNPHVLSAVAEHTMGCEGMDKLSCIVFVADYIEAGRNHPGVDTIRKAAQESLEKAVVACLDDTIGYILENGRLLHPQTIATRNWALEQLRKHGIKEKIR